jgi:hypothetical protein
LHFGYPVTIAHIPPPPHPGIQQKRNGKSRPNPKPKSKSIIWSSGASSIAGLGQSHGESLVKAAGRNNEIMNSTYKIESPICIKQEVDFERINNNDIINNNNNVINKNNNNSFKNLVMPHSLKVFIDAAQIKTEIPSGGQILLSPSSCFAPCSPHSSLDEGLPPSPPSPSQSLFSEGVCSSSGSSSPVKSLSVLTTPFSQDPPVTLPSKMISLFPTTLLRLQGPSVVGVAPLRLAGGFRSLDSLTGVQLSAVPPMAPLASAKTPINTSPPTTAIPTTHSQDSQHAPAATTAIVATTTAEPVTLADLDNLTDVLQFASNNLDLGSVEDLGAAPPLDSWRDGASFATGSALMANGAAWTAGSGTSAASHFDFPEVDELMRMDWFDENTQNLYSM